MRLSSSSSFTLLLASMSSLVSALIPISRRAIVASSRHVHQSARPIRSTTQYLSTSTNKEEQGESSSFSGRDKILLNPTAPLHPLLNTPSTSDPSHISQYMLPSLAIGTDDYRPKLKKHQRIVAFGDVHGDLPALQKFLTAAKVVDPANTTKWTGGDTILVQTGDILDRGAKELECFRTLCTLARQAEEVGGKVYVLYGNHESLNAAGLFQYADPEGNVEFEETFGAKLDENFGSNRWRLQFGGNEPARWAACEPGGLLAHGGESMMENMMVSCLIGRTVFVHGGLRAEHLINDQTENTAHDGDETTSYDGISRMNAQAREWILQHHHGNNNNWGDFTSVEEVIKSAQHRARTASKAMPDCLGGGIGASSPVWMRDYSRPNDAPPSPNAKDMLDKTLKAAGEDVQRIVMGHTPQYKINSVLGGRAWRIDVGASQGVMGGTPEVLEIIHGGEDEEDIVSVLTVDGNRIEAKERAVVENVLF